ncbi:A/G-specific adenine glycosylase [Parasulfuritortus cantonensis]|uniref:Adenine DNA glycosylase n=1 Tax=Parasulfuritortus cantonensis TaxID=2528202 RepID=A0A4R1BEB2_9PROT|nr:A/G-specific adenine glycosylase [Parasulfuritortus cantonensis]TCJ15441.1 A/G-specific adenine glycosylase [Parasulfuritortus cantonensis]
MAGFADRLVAWQRQHGRHDLPWQVSDPYAVWVSEIMLQQTQVDTVIPYYVRFLARFPDLASLAEAPEDAVLALWSGLGYYARARNLHAAAKRVLADHGGVFPGDVAAIAALPGIGRSTAAAIAAFAFGGRHAILDGNVKRVFCRLFGVDGWPGEKAVETALWHLAEALLPEREIVPYTQGLMDLGATLCRRSRPDCPCCPFADDCVACRDGRQAELPAARPRKGLPERSTVMLVLRHGGEILLEKRPPSGIWGGLWSLPECAPGDDPVAAARRLGYSAEPLAELPGLSHTFSHFRLAIRPVALAVARRAPGAGEPGALWLAPADAVQAALPTPVRRIIAAL